MIKSLPSMEHTFTIKVKGSKTGRTYDGSFVYKMPDLFTETKISKMKARLSEGLMLDDDMELLHEMLAYLSNTLTEFPDWWEKKLSNLETYDYNVYTEIYKECLNFEKKWKEQVWEEDEEEPKKAKSKEDSKVS